MSHISTTKPIGVKEVGHAKYAIYMIRLLFEFLLKGQLQLFRGRPESGVICIPEH